MFGLYARDNNVKVTLAAPITTSSTSIIVNKATGIFRDPPDPTSAPYGAIITLVDTANPPTKIEIIAYGSRVDNGDGTWTLSSLGRHQQSTTAHAFSAGDIAYQAMTRDDILPFGLDTGSNTITAGDPFGLYNFQALLYKDFLGNQVVGTRKTGWDYGTDTADKTYFASYIAPTLGASYDATTQGQLQAALAHVQVLSRQVSALKRALLDHGLIGT